MSRHFCRTIILAIVILLGKPHLADAGGILGWLGRMSGPGPFWGVDLSVCVPPSPWPLHKGQHETTKAETTKAEAIILCKPEIKRGDLTWYATVGFAFASNNQLDYGDSGGREKSRTVWTINAGTTLSYTLFDPLDVGTGVGFLRFDGPSFDYFLSPYVEPIILTLRPGLLARNCKGAKCRAVVISAAWHMLRDTVNGASFGAPDDPWERKNESRLAVGLSLDLYKLLSK